MEGWQAKPDGVVRTALRITIAVALSPPSNHPALAGTPPQEGNRGDDAIKNATLTFANNILRLHPLVRT